MRLPFLKGLLCARGVVCITNLIQALHQFSGLGTVITPRLKSEPEAQRGEDVAQLVTQLRSRARL